MNDVAKKLTARFIKENADLHYTSRDKKMSVWICHQIGLVEVSGIWTPEIAAENLERLWVDFQNLRKKLSTVYFVFDCDSFVIQGQGFRDYLKSRWETTLYRNDLVVCLVEKNTYRRTIRKAILQLIRLDKRFHMFDSLKEAFDFIFQHQTSEDCEDETDEQNSLKSAQEFIRDQMLKMAATKLVQIDDIVWDQRENDWQAEVHYLAVYIANRRYALTFSQIELTSDQGSKTWERMILDKIQWFLLDYVPTKQPERYKELDAGKSWIETQLKMLPETIGKKDKILLTIGEWKNPDKLKSARRSEQNNVGLEIIIAGHEISLLFLDSEIKNCMNSKDIQDKIKKYLEAKVIYAK